MGAEGLYALDLSELIVPEALSDGAVVCRPPHLEERDMLCAWRMAYDIEILGGTDSEEHRQRSAHFLDSQIAEGNAWGKELHRVGRAPPPGVEQLNATGRPQQAMEPTPSAG